KHTLAFRSNFDTTSRVRGGGGALTDSLRARGTELGVEFRFDQLVDRLDCAYRRVVEVHTAAGERFAADTFVAACHPKPILRAISDQHVRPLFKDRILEMRESRGAVQLFARLREPLRSLGATCVMLRDPAQEHGDPPLSTVLVTCPSAIEGEGSGDARIEAMTYMHIDPFVRWIDRPVLKRGAEYEAFKQRLVERMLDLIATHAPELRSCIDQVYSSTPLTDLWYTRNEQGGVFGISHDVSQQGSERPMIRLRLKNLFFTGHSITMPGICGTFINAFDSCDAIRGDGVLFDAVAV
ncbi:MAG: FAD-dependent oxidoreductase, partial [Planctomycetes bacterium]|nr:FAD-dependent oxidoreductase [Planctomycetota bacterium]